MKNFIIHISIPLMLFVYAQANAQSESSFTPMVSDLINHKNPLDYLQVLERNHFELISKDPITLDEVIIKIHETLTSNDKYKSYEGWNEHNQDTNFAAHIFQAEAQAWADISNRLNTNVTVIPDLNGFAVNDEFYKRSFCLDDIEIYYFANRRRQIVWCVILSDSEKISSKICNHHVDISHTQTSFSTQEGEYYHFSQSNELFFLNSNRRLKTKWTARENEADDDFFMYFEAAEHLGGMFHRYLLILDDEIIYRE